MSINLIYLINTNDAKSFRSIYIYLYTQFFTFIKILVFYIHKDSSFGVSAVNN